jgi:hypothetical protein
MNQEQSIIDKISKRSLITKIIFTFSMVFYGLSVLVIIFALFFHGFLYEIISIYVEGFHTTDWIFFAVLSGLLILYLFMLVGVLLLFKANLKVGLLLYVFGLAGVFLIQLFTLTNEGYQKIYIDAVISVLIFVYFWITDRRINRKKSSKAVA